MSFIFKNKKILIISQQPWGEVKISKHHYALELLCMGNQVFFLNPPDPLLSRPVEVKPSPEGIHLVSYRPCFPFVIRFHARPLFDFLMRWQIKKILKEIGVQLDVVWCFEFNLFTDLSLFGAPVKIYHPVDPLSAPYQIAPALSATIVFAVSQDILDSFKKIPTPHHVINHGLSSAFVEPPLVPDFTQKLSSIKVGYVGNLSRSNVDLPLFRQLISDYPQVEFHIIGPMASKSNLGGEGSGETVAFLEFINSSPNVICHGQKPPSEVARIIRDMDAFLLCYQKVPGIYDLSNSHKILEYLSTGKTVVSSRISTYEGRDLLVMGEPEEMKELFRKVMNDLPFYNSAGNQKRRMAFALENTYRKQIERVEAYLTDLHVEARP
ncbi:MAG: hypothetical protein JWN25_2629 [Verrucomicrobiales bacterium]|nr:hypothetical protein [Verrucomicrobiales bacterium]